MRTDEASKPSHKYLHITANSTTPGCPKGKPGEGLTEARKALSSLLTSEAANLSGRSAVVPPDPLGVRILIVPDAEKFKPPALSIPRTSPPCAQTLMAVGMQRRRRDQWLGPNREVQRATVVRMRNAVTGGANWPCERSPQADRPVSPKGVRSVRLAPVGRNASRTSDFLVLWRGRRCSSSLQASPVGSKGFRAVGFISGS